MGFAGRWSCNSWFKDGRRGVSGADEREMSSLLEGRLSSDLVEREAEAGFEASDRERDLGDGRNGGPSKLFFSVELLKLFPESFWSLRCDNCSLNLLASGAPGRLCETVDEVNGDMIARLMTNLTCQYMEQICSQHDDT